MLLEWERAPDLRLTLEDVPAVYRDQARSRTAASKHERPGRNYVSPVGESARGAQGRGHGRSGLEAGPSRAGDRSRDHDLEPCVLHRDAPWVLDCELSRPSLSAEPS